MNGMILATFLAFCPPSVYRDPGETAKQELMTHLPFAMTWSVVLDFDRKPGLDRLENVEKRAIVAFLTSRDDKIRAEGVGFFWSYTTLKRQVESDADSKQLAKSLEASLGGYKKSVVAKEFLGDKEAKRRTEALKTVLLLGKQAKETAPTIAKMLVSEDPAIMGDVPIMRIGLPVSEDLAYMCLTRIGSDGRDAMPVLLTAAKKSPRTSPPKVLHLLGIVGGESKEAIDLLHEALKSDSADVRMHAASGLLLAKPHDAEALKYLKDSLESDKEQLQKSAMEALARVGPSAKPAVPSIVKILKVTSEEEVTNEEDRARQDRIREIADVLARIGPGAEEAVPELERLLTKGNYDFQLAEMLAYALAKQGKEGEAALLRVFLDKPVRYREYAAGAIGDYGEKAGEESVKALIEELDSPDGLCTCEVIASLGKIGPKAKKAAPALKEITEKKISKDDRPDAYYAKLLAGWALKRVSD